jgi:hypothetical protein
MLSHDPISYLCGIDDPERIRQEARGLGVEIISERQQRFLSGPPAIQFSVRIIATGDRGLLVPAGKAATERQGGRLAPYSWVSI